MTAPHHHGTRLLARTGFLFGSATSIWFNVLDVWLPATRQPRGWHPDINAQLGAAIFPVVLLISVEILTRTRWKPGLRWSTARFLGGGSVAVSSAVISYTHVHAVAQAWGYGPGSWFVPICIDGLMLSSGFALLNISHTPTTTGPVNQPTPAAESPESPGDSRTDSGESPDSWNDSRASRADSPPRTAVAFTPMVELPGTGPIPGVKALTWDDGSRFINLPDESPAEPCESPGDSSVPVVRDRVIHQLNAEGLSTREIARRVGVSQPTVVRVVKRGDSPESAGESGESLSDPRESHSDSLSQREA